MPVSFECKVEKEVCSKVESSIRMLLERAGFDGEADIKVIIGRPEKCAGACVIYDTNLEEKMATFNALTSILTFALGYHLSRRGLTCKYWLVDGLAAVLATRLMEDEFPGFSGELEGKVGGLVGEDQLEERFGALMLTGPGMVTLSSGKGPEDAIKAATAALEYLNNPMFRVSAAKAVKTKLERDPSSWSEVLEVAGRLCKT